MKPVKNLRTITLDIFPGKPGVKAGYINLDDWAKVTQPEGPVSPFLTPKMAQDFLETFNRTNEVDCTYGGYLEDRSTLWRGLPLIPSDKAIHEGIDVNVPAGTPLAITRKATLVKTILGADLRNDQDGGWGNVLFFKLQKPVAGISHFLYAHLAADDVKRMQSRVGQTIYPGEVVAHTGVPEENGGWFAHVHIQAFSKAGWETTKHGALNEEVFGYSAHDRAKIYPDPTPILRSPR